MSEIVAVVNRKGNPSGDSIREFTRSLRGKREVRLMKRVCHNCNRNILKVDRWHQTWHRFLWWRWKTYEHFNCADPSMGPAKPRLKGEVPLPFPGPMPEARVQ